MLDNKDKKTLKGPTITSLGGVKQAPTIGGFGSNVGIGENQTEAGDAVKPEKTIKDIVDNNSGN